MSVNHFLISITNAELASLKELPERIHDLIEGRSTDVRGLGEDGLAIVALTAESDKDPLAFLSTGAPDDVSGWIGQYVEEDGVCKICEVDMGYGPASYYNNSFLKEVGRNLERWTIETFANGCDINWLEENGVYPSGWTDDGRKESLIESFTRYRSSVFAAAESGHHLLVWCA
jgi:hypothetical protein